MHLLLVTDSRIGYLHVYLKSFVKDNTMFILGCPLVHPPVPVCITLQLGLSWVHEEARRSHDGEPKCLGSSYEDLLQGEIV